MCLNRLGKLEIPILSALPGTPGLPGQDGNVWLSGIGVPTAQLGNLNDYYLDTATNLVWNKTSSTTWTIITNLNGSIGPQGPVGPVSTEPSTVPGPPGVGIIFNYEGISTTSTTYVSILSFGPTITAGSIELNDIAVFEVGINNYYQDAGGLVTTNIADFKLLLNGSSITSNPITSTENSLSAGKGQITSGRLRVTVNRKSATRGLVTVTFIDINGNSVSYNANELTIDFSQNIFVNVQGKIRYSVAASYIKCTDLSLTIFKS